MNTLGSQSKPILAAKAAESKGLLHFAVDLLERHMLQVAGLGADVLLKAQLLLSAGRAAVGFETVMNTHSRSFSCAQKNMFFHQYHRFVTLYLQAGGEVTPKVHLMYHLILESERKGNPKFYQTYHDETMNGIVAKIAASCHRLTWARSIMRKFYIRSCIGLVGLCRRV